MARCTRRQFLAQLPPALAGLSALFHTPSHLLAQAPRPTQNQAPQSAPAPCWFTDIAPRSQFSYITNNHFTGRKFFPQPMCGGVAAFDYNNDGFVDLFFTNGAELPSLKKTGPAFANCLLRNRGDGTFEDVTARAGLLGMDLGFCFGVAAADFNNDGLTDLFIANAGRNALYRNNGDGTFTDITVGSGLDRKPDDLLSVGAAWIDIDNDGLLDLIVTNYTYWSPSTDKLCRIDATREEYCSPTTYKSVASRLYRNLGNGKFEDITDQSGIGKALGKGMGISIADFTGNGLMDIFIANDTEPNFVFINQGNGKFQEQALAFGAAFNMQGQNVSGMGCDARDFDNDGRVDIVYNDLSGQIFGLLRNSDGASFDDITWSSKLGNLSRKLSGWSIGFIDYNNDGWKDIYSANGDVDNLTANSQQHDTIFRNLDGKTLADVSAQMGTDFLKPGYQRGSAFVDLNNDGYLDLVVTSLNQRPRILLNNGLEKNHWSLLHLEGTRSNRDAIGATVKLTTASGRTLYNHVNPSVGFMSTSDKRLHFGLGQDSKIATIEIRWPSGTLQTIPHPAADTILKITEPPRQK